MSRINLTVLPTSNSPLLIASKTRFASGASVTMTLDEYRTFRLYMFHLFRVITDGSSAGVRFGELVRINDTLKEVLYFLYADIARLVAPGLSAHEQLEETALALCPSNVTIPLSFYQTRRIDSARWGTPGRYFFDMSVVQRVCQLSPQLLGLTLNAVENLDEIKHIVNCARPEDLPILLSAPGAASIKHLKHLNIQRTGTPLQMALYGDDEDIVDYLKTVMDPAEFERQSKEVFSNALSPSTQAELDAQNAPALEYYNAMLIVQKAEAKKLCNEIFAFRIADGNSQFTINNATVAAFQRELENYVRNNPAHNPFILHRLYEIFEKLSDIHAEDRLFSEKVIGYAQALSSARWLQHYAQGIYHLGDGIAYGAPEIEITYEVPEIACRSFVCGDSITSVDVRFLIPAKLGLCSFISVLGDQTQFTPWWPHVRALTQGARAYEEILSSKNSELSELVTQPMQACDRKRECVVQ